MDRPMLHTRVCELLGIRHPVRRNALIREWAGREWELRRRRPEVAAAVIAARAAGDVERAPLLYGQDAALIDAVEPVALVIDRMVREAHEILIRRLPSLVRSD